jgi:hypothetical protein
MIGAATAIAERGSARSCLDSARLNMGNAKRAAHAWPIRTSPKRKGSCGIATVMAVLADTTGCHGRPWRALVSNGSGELQAEAPAGGSHDWNAGRIYTADDEQR